MELVFACVVLHNYFRKGCRSDVFLPEENGVKGSDDDEEDDDENNDDEMLHGTQEQQ